MHHDISELKERLKLAESKNYDMKAIVGVVRDSLKNGELSLGISSDVAILKQAFR